MLKFLINLFKGFTLVHKSNTRRYFRKSLTYTYFDNENIVTKTIEDVEIIIKETTYGKACNVICQEDLTQEEVMAIIRMFL